MVDQPSLKDILRRLEVIEHELEEYAVPRPANGDDVTIARRKVFEAKKYVERAIERES